jgi:hemerythrin-like metal-binding protein
MQCSVPELKRASVLRTDTMLFAHDSSATALGKDRTDAMTTYSELVGHVPLMQFSLASRLQWDSHRSIGNSTLDVQDRMILGLAHEIHDRWGQGATVGQYRSIADRSLRVLEAHFRCEERMLAEVGYPLRMEHAAEHGQMLTDLATIRRCLNGCDGIQTGYAGLILSNFILGVTFGHIPNADDKYCRYIADETDKLSTGCA